MSGETGMTEMKKGEVVKDKEMVLILIKKQKKVSEVEEEHIWRWNNGVMVRQRMWYLLKQLCCQVLITHKHVDRQVHTRF